MALKFPARKGTQKKGFETEALEGKETWGQAKCAQKKERGKPSFSFNRKPSLVWN